MAQSTIPEGHGKAEAMRTFLARGGGLTKLGKFRDGPMKGMTMQQAQSHFESKWSGASDQVKDKYAGIARNVLTPAEDAASAQNQKPEPAGSMIERQKESRMGFYQRTGQAGIPRRDSMVPGQSAIAQGPPSSTQSPAAAPPAPAIPRPVAGMPAVGTVVQPGMETDERMHAQGKINNPATGAPYSLGQRELLRRRAAVEAAPTGKPVIPEPAKGINRLTGLPIGYQPGDKLPEGSDQAMAQRAANSETRQLTASTTAVANRLKPGSIPRKSVEQRAADEMRRQAAINANPSQTNADDPAKFFTGKSKPLDQLVNPAKAPSSGIKVGDKGPSGGRVIGVRPGNIPRPGGNTQPKFAGARRH